MAAMVGRGRSSAKGSAFLYILVVMLIFGLLGSAMISMYTSAEWMTKGVPNEATQARSLAESGMRYAVSELRNDGYRRAVISRLNTTTYTVDDAGDFDLNVFGKWFQADADHTGSTDIALAVPEGEVPNSFSIPANVYLLNLESARDALIFDGSWDPDFVGLVPSAPDMTAVPLSVALNDDLVADQNQPVLLAVQAAGDQAPSGGGSLTVAPEAADVFPVRNGSFYIQSTLDEKQLYYYETLIDNTTSVDLTKISRDLTVTNGDYVALAERNHHISVTASAGSTAFGGAEELSMDFLQNISTPQTVSPPALDLPADIPPNQMVPGMAAPVESAPAAVTVDTGTGKITLGGGTANSYGAVWFGGNLTLGGFDVCTGGKCDFNTGIRSFFIVDYNGTGDGFTFALINGTDNDVTASGGQGGTLGYAGLNPGAGSDILAPKMALEFDTFTNAGRNDPDEAGWNNRDVLQFVHWGTDAANLSDDNVHAVADGTDNSGLKLKSNWPFTNPWGAIVTKPAVDPSSGTIYVGSRDDNLWAINPDGTEKDRFDSGGDIFASPTVGSDGTVYGGTDAPGGGELFALDPADNWTNYTQAASYKWWVTTSSNVRTQPVLDSSGNVYASTWINSDSFYGVDSGGSALTGWPSLKPSAAALNPYHQSDATPAVDEANDAIYFASMYTPNHAYLHALHLDGTPKSWSPIQLAGPGFSSPTVNLIDGDPDRGTIYIGNDGGGGEGFLYAFNPDGSQKWRTTISWTNPRSKPAIGPDGTIYIGNDDDNLYAVSPDGTEKWHYTTGDNVRGEPLVGSDGAIYFGSQDTFLYAVDTEGRLLGKYDIGATISVTPDEHDNWADWVYAASPGQGPDGTVYMGTTAGDVYAFEPTCFPQNIKNRYFTTEDLPAAVQASLSSTDNWLNSDLNLPWAVRTEVHRSTSVNSRNKYEYTWKMWIRQCGDSSCSDILGTYFQDTRIDYAAKDPGLEQTVELCASDHNKFGTFLFGFTEGTGSDVQTVDLTQITLGFRRPGDVEIADDPDWP